jgi:hypothetical protein
MWLGRFSCLYGFVAGLPADQSLPTIASLSSLPTIQDSSDNINSSCFAQNGNDANMMSVGAMLSMNPLTVNMMMNVGNHSAPDQ